MVMALTLSNRLGHCPGNDAARLRAHLDATGLPADFTRLNADGWTADRLLAHMMKDKKTEDGKLTFILARAIGAAFIEHDVPTGPVADVLTEFLSARG